jgi:hypothetical protein
LVRWRNDYSSSATNNETEGASTSNSFASLELVRLLRVVDNNNNNVNENDNDDCVGRQLAEPALSLPDANNNDNTKLQNDDDELIVKKIRKVAASLCRVVMN